MRVLHGIVGVGVLAAPALAQTSNYDDLTEGFLGTSYSYNGVNYHSVNGVSGVFPDGSTFTPADGGDQLIIENATYLFNDYPSWGSPSNVMTFGTSYVPGDNLTLGAFAQVTMDLDQVSDSASVEMVFYENGPWGGIVFHLEALSGGSVVDSDSFAISDLGGRDNIAFNTLSVGGAPFDSLYMYATYGSDFSLPRLMIDDLTLDPVPAPTTAALLGLGALATRRRR